ncbi:MAG TPA: hypothetical protein PL180_16850 [Spirochaetota bacterium]|nr:hypothetical protein [Spirochaetota bacterium]HPL18358.1 hypothetical protein [Spirochaetota bacterium]HRS79580.1 hypothetical protein [Spirochaetota bacterium]HRT76943.1 hypothetical protein [Spirochaetota bacterium]
MKELNDSNYKKKLKIGTAVLIALLILAASLICAYITCSSRKDTAVSDTGNSIENKKKISSSSDITPDRTPAPQPVEIEKKIQQKISQKVGQANPKPEKSKKEKKDFEDEPVGNVVNW